MKKALCILFALVILAVSVACSRNGQDSDEDGDNEYNGETTATLPNPETQFPTVPHPSEPLLADAVKVIVDEPVTVINQFLPGGNTSATQWTQTMILDRLVENLGNGEYGPMLATSWHTTDCKTYVFELREGVTFHNSDLFTAEDVVFTVNAALNAGGTLGYERWRTVESVRALGPYQVEINLFSTNIDFLFDISSPAAGILSERAYSEMGGEIWTQIGTGPFRIAEFEPDDFVRLERFDGFWGQPAQTREVTLQYVPEAEERARLMLSGGYDVCFSVGSVNVAQFESSPDFQIVEMIFNAPNCIGFNMEDPLMANRNFRSAITYAIDRQEVVDSMEGVRAVAQLNGNTWGYATEFGLDDTPSLRFDPELARQYLEVSPWSGETIEIAVYGRANMLAAENVREQLKRNLDMEVTIVELDAASFFVYVRTADEAQMHIFPASFTLSAAESVQNVYYPGVANNRTRYSREYVTLLIDEICRTVDLDSRIALFHELQWFVMDDPPYLALFWSIDPVVAASGVEGMQLGHDAMKCSFRGIYRVL